MFINTVIDLFYLILTAFERGNSKTSPILLSTILVVVLALLVFALAEKPNEIGDWLAGFAGTLAFLWLVYGNYMQRIELGMQRKALDIQGKELKSMNNFSALQLIKDELQQMDTLINQSGYSNLDNLAHIHLQGKLKETKKEIDAFTAGNIDLEDFQETIYHLSRFQKLIIEIIDIFTSTAITYFKISHSCSFNFTDDYSSILNSNEKVLKSTPYLKHRYKNIFILNDCLSDISFLIDQGQKEIAVYQIEYDE